MFPFDYFLINHRWFYICFCLLPLSLFCDVYYYLKDWMIFKLYSSPKQHDQKTRNIQKQILQWIKSGQKLQIRTSYSDNQISRKTETYKNDFYNIKMNLIDILEINKDKNTVTVEPLVSIHKLISTILPLGWTIPVVPVDNNVSIGALVLGTGLDSSSHKYGFFHNTCVAFEMILSDGRIVKCSKDENSELFHAVPLSFGTLGILTAINIQMVPAHNFVKLQFKAFHNIHMGLKNFLTESKNEENDFVESLLYNDHQCIIITGQMVGQVEPKKLNEIGKWYKPWFFRHVKSYFKKGVGIEYVPLKDYYYRHTRSHYWELSDIIPFVDNVFFRTFFGWTAPPKLSFLRSLETECTGKLHDKQPIMLDVIFHSQKLEKGINKVLKFFEIYPVWLCPIKINKSLGFLNNWDAEDIYLNIGIYGLPKAIDFHAEDCLKELEKFLKEVRGFKMLYGNLHISEEDFRQEFDHILYDKMRIKLSSQKAFPSIYEKIRMNKNKNYFGKNK